MQHDSASSVPTERTIIEAIALKRMIVANYNGAQMQLAPHQLFTRHGDLFVSALNIGKNWRSLEERRLGFFKLEGLSGVAISDDSFDPLPDFDGTLPGESDTPVFAIAA